MTPDAWVRLKAVVQEALERAPDARAAFVAAACSHDSDLRREVDSLLAAHERAVTFLEMPAAALLDDTHVRQTLEGRAGPPFRGTERFTVVRRLGAGGMGVVYEVHDRTRDEVVALKTLLHASAADLYRLKREFRSLADVAHTNLVSLYELVVEHEQCFFTMELVNGVNLVEHVRGPAVDSNAPLADRIRRVLPQLIEGLLALHRKGKLHRDIKPSNVLVTPAGRVVILDFGLTTDVLPDTAGGLDTIGGTPAYIAPEQVAGTVTSDATDWYSVGVTLYELLTGRVPFDGPPLALLRRKQESDPPPPAQIAPDVPDDLSAMCMGLLCRDPARRLSGRDALRQLATGAVVTAESPSSAPPRREPSFVGRERELDILNGAFLGATHGCAGVVCIHGPSGIGKSALVQCFLDRMLQREDVVVLRGRCHERESVPYKALDGVIDSLSRYLDSLPRSQARTLVPHDVLALARLFPVMLQVDAVATAPSLESEIADPLVLRRRAFSSLRELLARIADRQPLVLYIDDLHWADPDSALLLEEVLRPPQPPPLLMLACFRSEEVAAKPFLQTLLERAGSDACMVLPLEPMTEDEARELIASLIPEPSVNRIEKIKREAGGNPFLLEQLARYIALNETGPDTFAEMLKGRMHRLPQGGRRFLETLALCGRPMAADLVYEASGLAGDERPLVALLRSERFLRSSGSVDRVEIYHDRIRDTLVARVSPVDERRIHGLMVQTLVARRVDDPEALYEHYRGAGDGESASAQAALAARKADAALAFDRAASFYRGALALAPDAPARFGWREGLADALANAGRPAEASDVYLEAAAGADATRRVELQRRAAEQLLIGGQIDRGLDVIRAVLSEVGARLAAGPRMALASLMVRRAQLRWRGMDFVARDADQIGAADLFRIDTYWSVTTGLLMLDPIRSAEFHTRHLLLALDAGEPYRIARGMAVEAGLSAVTGGPSLRRTAALVERAHMMAGSVGHPHAIALATLAAGSAEYLVGHWKKATVLCDRALGILRARCVGVTWELNCAQNFLLGSLLYQGEIQEVSRRFPILLADAREHGNLYIETELRTRMTYVSLAADDPDEGERQADEIMKHWSHRAFDRQQYSRVLSRLQIELYRGRAPAAWGLIAENWAAIKRSLLLRVQSFRIEASYVRARSALLMAASGGDTRRFLSVARDEARRIQLEKMPWSDPLALLVSAAVAYLEGNTVVAEDRLARAGDGFDLADMKLHATAVRRRRGALLGGDGGREMMRQADDWMAAQGIRNITRMTRLIAPGFPDSSSQSQGSHILDSRGCIASSLTVRPPTASANPTQA